MGSITNYLEDELLDHVFNVAFTPGTALYLCLCTADPTDAATGAAMNEVADSGSYARTLIAFGAAASRTVTQSGAVTFPEATGAWGTVTDWAIADSGTYGVGNVYAYGGLSEDKAIVSENTPSIGDGVIYVDFNAGTISDYLANSLLDLALRNQAFSAPDTYIALCDATVGDSDTGSTVSEPSGGAYARVQVNINGGASPTWDLAASGLVDNAHDITFTAASAPWGTVVAMSICDAASVGNVLYYNNAMADQPVGTSDTMFFAAGGLDISKS